MACPRVKKPRPSAAPALFAAAVAAGLCFAPLSARAATLDELQAQIDSCGAAFDDAVTRANELQDQVAANEERIAEIQDDLPQKREAASRSLRVMYKLRSNTLGVIDLLLSSESFNEVVSTVQYLDAVVSHNNAAIDGLVSASDELTRTQADLESEKAEADAKVASAMESLTQANRAREQYEAQLAAEKAAAEAAEKAAAEKAAAEAAEKAAKEAEDAAADSAARESAAESSATSGSGQADSDGGDSAKGTGQSAGQDADQVADQGDSSSASGSASTSGSASSGSSSTKEVETDGEWMSGLASAYDIEDNTGGTATASGIPLTHDSMTVAVPVSQSYLLGRTVQIRYAGKTITATVTDTGGFASYGRVLDLAGGCWQAFGFSSGDDWGVRAVQYRFL